MNLRILFIIAGGILFLSTSLAQTIFVDCNGGADSNNIQAAINEANNGDTIIVQPGRYAGSGNQDIDFLGKAITLCSIDSDDPCIVATTIIDINFTNHRGIKFIRSEGPNSILEGLTIINSRFVTMCPGGAAIYISGASPTINKCNLINNYAILDPNSLCYCYGGGIDIEGGNPVISNCVINHNSAGDWGKGGGIFCEGASVFNINNCIVNDNNIWNPDYGGGGIFIEDLSYLVMINCTVTNNRSSKAGGGVCFEYSNPYCNIRNSIFWNNLPDQIYPVKTPPRMLVTYSDIEGGWTGNINVDPCFADATNDDFHLKSQAGRWNPISQSWVQDAVTSLCVDAGNPSSNWTVELWPNGHRINMGAYGGTTQASMSLSTVGNIADLDNNNQVNYNDLTIFAGKWFYQKILLVEDLDRNGVVDFRDFAIFANNWFWTQ